jgi:hypothetical protein
MGDAAESDGGIEGMEGGMGVGHALASFLREEIPYPR